MHASTIADIQTRRLTCVKESTDNADRVGFKRRRSFPDPRRQTRCLSILMQTRLTRPPFSKLMNSAPALWAAVYRALIASVRRTPCPKGCHASLRVTAVRMDVTDIESLGHHCLRRCGGDSPSAGPPVSASIQSSVPISCTASCKVSPGAKASSPTASRSACASS